MKLIVGLGNPGPTYSLNRHNIGFLTIDKILEKVTANNISNKKFLGELYKVNNLILLKPNTFMNLSGKSVAEVVKFYKIDLDNILVIHDDIDLPFGAVKLKKGGGHGGHNGLKSIDTLVGKNYNRLRLGVDKPEYKTQVPNYVLSDFNNKEKEELNKFIEYAADVALKFLDRPLIELKSKFSRKDIRFI